MNDLIIFDNPEQVKMVRLYLTRSGKGGYLLRSELVDMDGKASRSEKRYPKKQFMGMKVVVQKLLEKLKERGLTKRQLTFESALMNFNPLN